MKRKYAPAIKSTVPAIKSTVTQTIDWEKVEEMFTKKNPSIKEKKMIANLLNGLPEKNHKILLEEVVAKKKIIEKIKYHLVVFEKFLPEENMLNELKNLKHPENKHWEMANLAELILFEAPLLKKLHLFSPLEVGTLNHFREYSSFNFYLIRKINNLSKSEIDYKDTMYFCRKNVRILFKEVLSQKEPPSQGMTKENYHREIKTEKVKRTWVPQFASPALSV